MIRILVALTFVSLATARPGFKNIFDRVLHKKAFDHAMKKRTDEGACVATATVAGELLESLGPVISGGRPPGPPGQGPDPNEMIHHVHSIFNHLAGFDVFDQEQRERILCGISGLSTLSELLAAQKELGLDYQAVKDVYNIAAVYSVINRYSAGQVLDDETNPWYDEDYIKSRELSYELSVAVETSGFLALDPEGTAFVQNMINVVQPVPQTAIAPLEVSDVPTSAKCSRIANAARKLWNNHITTASEWNPNVSQETRDNIKQWTGIDLANHGAIRSMICELLESGLDGGVRGIYEWLEERRVFSNLTKTGYPILVGQVQQLKMMLEMMSNNGPPSSGDPQYNDVYPSYNNDSPPYPSYGPPNYPSYGPSQEHIAMMGLVLQALEGLEDMGLLSLRDDL